MDKLSHFSLTTVPVLNVHQWKDTQHLEESVGHRKSPVPLVDIRSTDEYNKIHITSSTSQGIKVVNLPLDSLISGKRGCELPPRIYSFGVLIPKEFYCITTTTTMNDDYDDKEGQKSVIRIHDTILTLFLGANHNNTNTLEKNSNKKNKAGWKIDLFLLESSDLWNESSTLGILESSDDNKETMIFPLTRLWQPSKLVEEEIFSQISRFFINNICAIKDKQMVESKNIQVWDLGCGSGRDICFLAEEIKKSFLLYRNNANKTITNPIIEFIGLDRHKASRDRSILLWKNRMVDDIANWKQFDLNKVSLFHDELLLLKNNNEDNVSTTTITTTLIIYAVRYLNMKLLKYITSDDACCLLPLNTIYAMSHFCQIDDDHPWEFEHPKIENVLKRNELNDLFQQNGKWKILKDEIVMEGADGDYGRPMIYFIAQRL